MINLFSLMLLYRKVKIVYSISMYIYIYIHQGVASPHIQVKLGPLSGVPTVECRLLEMIIAPDHLFGSIMSIDFSVHKERSAIYTPPPFLYYLKTL